MLKTTRKIYLRQRPDDITVAQFLHHPDKGMDKDSGHNRSFKLTTIVKARRIEKILKRADSYNFFIYPNRVTIVARFNSKLEEIDV